MGHRRDRRGRARPAVGAGRADRGRPGRYQIQAAIAALHDDATTRRETDWPQILAWYDDLVALSDDPVHQDPAGPQPRGGGRPRARCRCRAPRDRAAQRRARRPAPVARGPCLPLRAGRRPRRRRRCVRRGGRRATDVAERDHLIRSAARARAGHRRSSACGLTGTEGAGADLETTTM